METKIRIRIIETMFMTQGSETGGSGPSPGKSAGAAGDGSDRAKNSATGGKDSELLQEDETEGAASGDDYGDDSDSDDFADENECVLLDYI